MLIISRQDFINILTRLTFHVKNYKKKYKIKILSQSDFCRKKFTLN